MGNLVYMPKYDYGAYLAHHGIRGQKWGVRRFQNPDNTWTAAGKKRYGKEGLGPHANENGLGRRLMTGDHVLGRKRTEDKQEEYLKNRIQKRKEKGKDTSRLERRYEIRKNANIDLDKYLSNTSTKRLAAQNLLLGLGAESYRKARSRGEGRGSALTSALITKIGGIPLGYAADAIKEKRRYKKKK